MRYILGPWAVEEREGGAVFVPPAGAEVVVDLRGTLEIAAATGEGVFVTDGAAPAGYRVLGEGALSGAALDGLWEELTVAASPAALPGLTGPPPLMPDRRLNLALRCPRAGLLRRVRLLPGVSPLWPKVRAVERLAYASVRDRSLAGRMRRPPLDGETEASVDRRFHRRYLQALVDRYGVGYREFQLGAAPDGGDLPDEPPLPHGSTLTESFDTADSDTLGPDQSWTETLGNARIASNELSFDKTSFIHVRVGTDLAGSDQIVTLEVTALDNSTSIRSVYAGPAARFAAGADTFYTTYLRRNSTLDRIELLKMVNGSSTQLATKTVSHSLPDEVSVRVDGSDISALINGVEEIAPVTDTAITSGTRSGLFAFVNVNLVDGSAKADNWSATDLVAVTVGAGRAVVSVRSHRAAAGAVGIGDVALSESLAGGVAMSEVVG